jgi:subtilisin family serine protease
LAGLVKPDVLAPGTNVVAAFSSFFAEHNPGVMTEYDVARSVFNGQEYTWSSQSGTSMACPIVAGIIAQWLQAIPTLTRAQIMEAFAFTCRRHNPDLSYPSNDYGYGEIDAEAGLKYLMELTDGVEAIHNEARQSEAYNLAGQRVDSHYKGIVIINGRKELRK